MFRGREVVYVENGYKMLRQLAEQVKDIATVEATPKLEGKKLIMVLAPLPAGSKKPASKPEAPKTVLPKPQSGPKNSDSGHSGA